MANSISEWKDYQKDIEACGDKEWETDFAGFRAWIGNPYWVRSNDGETLGLVRLYYTRGCKRHWCACHPETGEVVFLYGKPRTAMHSKMAACAYLCWAALME